MKKMSGAQRNAILAMWSAPGDTSAFGHARGVTRKILRREGWLSGNHYSFAGLIAAGVDMDAIHAEALHAHALWEMEQAAAHQATPAYRNFARAVRASTGYRDALDILHAEALDIDEIREVGGTCLRMDGAHATHGYARLGEGCNLEREHAEALREDQRRRVAAAAQGNPEVLDGTLGGPEMVLAVLPFVVEQAHAEALIEEKSR
jgi:hypothetical protein